MRKERCVFPLIKSAQTARLFASFEHYLNHCVMSFHVYKSQWPFFKVKVIPSLLWARLFDHFFRGNARNYYNYRFSKKNTVGVIRPSKQIRYFGLRETTRSRESATRSCWCKHKPCYRELIWKLVRYRVW